MAGISSLGIGSGLDLNSLVEGLVRAERAPAEGRINRDQFAAQTRLSALGSLKSAVSNLLSSVQALQHLQVPLKASSSDSAIVGVLTDAGVTAASYRLQVETLAEAQSLASLPFADADEVLGEGELTLVLGGEETVITLAEGANTLRDVRDAINAGQTGVQAVIIRDGDGVRLLLGSGRTGIDGEMTLSVSAGVDTRLESAGMEVTVEARDAAFWINGLRLTAGTNSVADVISGLTLNLKQTTEEGAAVTITVAPDRDYVRSRLDALVKTYNAVVDSITASGRVAPSGGSAGPLVGDATLRAIQSSLRGAFLERTGADADGFAMLLDIGLGTGLDGKASLDSARLDEALAADEGAVVALVAGFAAGFGEVLQGFAGADGILKSRTDGLDAQLRRLSRQREALNQRMGQVEARLRAQFSALDALLSQFQNTSAFLSQQLAGLANLRPRNNS